MVGEGVVVHLRLFGFGDRPSRARALTVSLPPGATVGDLLSWWHQEQPGTSFDSLLVIVNGQEARHLQGEATPLVDGDHVTLMRPVAGGAVGETLGGRLDPSIGLDFG